MVGEEPEVSVRRDKGENPLRLPALEPHTRVEAHVVQEPGVLQGEMEPGGDCYSAVTA